ncbi:hypothetical protein Hanom_Chr04g00333591 [Helianthus anomalus]
MQVNFICSFEHNLRHFYNVFAFHKTILLFSPRLYFLVSLYINFLNNHFSNDCKLRYSVCPKNVALILVCSL